MALLLWLQIAMAIVAGINPASSLKGNMIEPDIRELAKAGPDISVEFAADIPGGRLGALRIMQVGHYYFWDADEFNHRSFHSMARLAGIRIRTKACKHVSCVVIQRIR